jgi:hypothetical protein
MTNLETIWDIIIRHVPVNHPVTVGQICSIVETFGNLDSEDREPLFPESGTARWRHNVAAVLEYRRSTGEIIQRENLLRLFAVK